MKTISLAFIMLLTCSFTMLDHPVRNTKKARGITLKQFHSVVDGEQKSEVDSAFGSAGRLVWKHEDTAVYAWGMRSAPLDTASDAQIAFVHNVVIPDPDGLTVLVGSAE